MASNKSVKLIRKEIWLDEVTVNILTSAATFQRRTFKNFIEKHLTDLAASVTGSKKKSTPEIKNNGD